MTRVNRHFLSPTVWVGLCLALPVALQAQTPPPQRVAQQSQPMPMMQDQQEMPMRGQGQQDGRMRERGQAPADAPRFSAAQAMAARGYFEEQGHQGYVPPRRQGEMSTMPARRWQIGQALPAGVSSYPLPRPLVLAMGTAPAGYRYVRAGGDILLVAESSNMVVDAIEDVAR